MQDQWKKVGMKKLKGRLSVPVDLFVKINEIKYVKIYRGTEKSLPGIVTKYSQKDLDSLYCHHEMFSTLASFFKSESNLAENQKKGPESVSSSQKILIVKEMIMALGINPSVAKNIEKLSRENIKSLVGCMGFGSILKEILDKGEYLGQHAMLVSFVSCVLLKKMDWRSPAIEEKLSTAGILHDIFLTSEVLLKVKNNIKPPHGLNHDEEYTYSTHVNKVVSLIRLENNISPDVARIIEDHHEYSKGEYFKEKKSVDVISQSSALFIIADRFCHEVHTEQGLDLAKFIKDWKEFELRYNKAAFKKPIQALKSLLDNKRFEMAS